jgi:6-phosphogluconolactonase
MKNYEILNYSTPLSLAQDAAEKWLDEVLAAAREVRPYSVALSGGRIAKDFFCAAAEGAKKRGISLATVDFFWADERCVPPRDPASNYLLADQFLFQPLALAPERLHRVPGELSPEQAARAATAELRGIVRANSLGQPVLDLVFLGMGEDGHIASLFPEMPSDQVASSDVYLAVKGSKPPPNRITLGYAPLRSATDVWVLASGSGKKEALEKSLKVEVVTPLGRLLEMRSRTKIFSDIS